MSSLDFLDQYEAEAQKQWDVLPHDGVEALTPEKIEELYSIAYQLYRDQQYKESLSFFRLLTLAKPMNHKYWKGLAASLHMNKEYEKAIHCYIAAIAMNKTSVDPYLYVHAADCFFALGNTQDGLKALDGAKHWGEKEKNEKILNHVSLMQELWK